MLKSALLATVQVDGKRIEVSASRTTDSICSPGWKVTRFRRNIAYFDPVPDPMVRIDVQGLKT